MPIKKLFLAVDNICQTSISALSGKRLRPVISNTPGAEKPMGGYIIQLNTESAVVIRNAMAMVG